MKPVTTRRRRLLAAGLLLAFLASGILPVQACLAATSEVAAQTACPDCASPCCGADRHCCATVAAACGAAMIPATVVTARALSKATPAATGPLDLLLRSAPAADVVMRAERPPAYSPPSALNIRFCRFQE